MTDNTPRPSTPAKGQHSKFGSPAGEKIRSGQDDPREPEATIGNPPGVSGSHPFVIAMHRGHANVARKEPATRSRTQGDGEVSGGRGLGEQCAYCRRTLENSRSRSRLAATKDHVHPRRHGGGRTVWCCRQCNALKKDMLEQDWLAFMRSYPEWWKNPLFSKFGLAHKKRLPRQRYEPQSPYKSVPIADTMEILRDGKKAWRAKKEKAKTPDSVPKAYDDPSAQAAFEAVYRSRLHMLRSDHSPPSGTLPSRTVLQAQEGKP